jgi:hypothetical protein
MDGGSAPNWYPFASGGGFGPASGNHWSDYYRNREENYNRMSPTAFNRMYGPGSWNPADRRSLKNDKNGELFRIYFTNQNGIHHVNIYYLTDKPNGFSGGVPAIYNGLDGMKGNNVAQTGGGYGSLAMDIASGSATGFGLATSLRYKLEWEYLRQARINRAISGDFSKPIKHSLRSIRWAGSGFTLAGGIIGGVNFAMSDKSWGDYGQLGISMLSTGLTLGSATAPIGIGIGVIDAFGGFNGFYNYLDNQQNFYNNTGGIMVPINGIPSFLPLK